MSSIELFSSSVQKAIKKDLIDQKMVQPLDKEEQEKLIENGFQVDRIDIRGQEYAVGVIRPIGLLDADVIGLNPDKLEMLKRLVEKLADFAEGQQNINDPGRMIMGSLLSKASEKRLELSTFHDKPLFPLGSLIRIDLILTQERSSPIRIFDINPVPQFYPISRAAVESFEDSVGGGVFPSKDNYISTISSEVNPDLQNGILSNFCLSDYSFQHQWVARKIRNKGLPYFLITPQDYDNANNLGLVVKHVRERNGLKAKTLIYPPGVRAAETKSLFALPSIAGSEKLFDSQLMQLLSDLVVPSRLLEMDSEGSIYVADRISRDGVSLDRRLFPEEELISWLSRYSSEPSLDAVIKTPDTSHSKGVDFVSREETMLTDDIRLALKNLKGNADEKGMFILQPYFSSRFTSDNQVYDLEVSVFFLKTQKNWEIIGGNALTLIKEENDFWNEIYYLLLIPKLWNMTQNNAVDKFSQEH